MKKTVSIDNYNKPFPTTLRSLIERKKTTITAVADYIKVSRQAVSQYQDGSTQPNAETVVKIAEYFNVSTDYLLTGNNRDVDESLNIACDVTGLSAEAIKNIIEWKNGDLFASIDRSYEKLDFLRSGNVESFVETIDSLIISPDFPMLLNNIILYKRAVLEFQKTENELIDVRKRFENDIDWINETIDEYDEKGLFDKKELIDLYLFRMQELIKNITRNIAKEGAENG